MEDILSFKTVLKQCQNSATLGYKIANTQRRTLTTTLENAIATVKTTKQEFETSPCYISGSTEMLSKQLDEIESALYNVSFAFQEDLENRRENLSNFSITLFGRTMTGKSTLMEILTEGNGDSIGNGSQRTTKDIRKYKWNNLEITDVPGIAAFNGEEDEQLAFEAAKTADLILFLFTDDGIQMPEADCFGHIIELGKPVICIMNVKEAISESSNMKFALRNIEKKFDFNRLDEIRKQFLAYSSLLGQDWGYIPFIYVHLKSAFLSQKTKDPDLAQSLCKASSIDFLKNRIIEVIKEKGEYYSLKTFIDIISHPMLSSMENLISQSLINSSQGRVIISKRKHLLEWKTAFERDGLSQISSKITRIKSSLESEIASFAEDHYSDKDADKAWNQKLKSLNIQTQCQDLLKSLEEQCNEKIQEVAREISNELKFSASFASDKALRMHKITDGKRVWDWSFTIAGAGLSIAAIITNIFGAACAGPLGWIALGVSAVGVAGSFLFKSRTVQEETARQKLESSLRENIGNTCQKLQAQMEERFKSLLSSHVDNLIKELDRINSVVFKLADTQRELAWNIDTHLLDLNKQIVHEALRLSGASETESLIVDVARIPGSITIFMLKDGTLFPAETKKQLELLMSEKISFVYYSDKKWLIIARTVGKEVNRSDIRIEENIGIAHIPLAGASPYLLNRVRLAQQLARIAITE